METIWKYILSETDEHLIPMPEGAKALSVQVQNNNVCIWMQVNPDNDKELRRVVTFGTGQSNIDTSGLQFVGTYQLSNGVLVFHVFID